MFCTLRSTKTELKDAHDLSKAGEGLEAVKSCCVRDIYSDDKVEQVTYVPQCVCPQTIAFFFSFEADQQQKIDIILIQPRSDVQRPRTYRLANTNSLGMSKNFATGSTISRKLRASMPRFQNLRASMSAVGVAFHCMRAVQTHARHNRHRLQAQSTTSCHPGQLTWHIL